MIRPIVKDPLALARRSKPAGREDIQTAMDLADTLRANIDRCVGMAANMIGAHSRVIAFCDGPAIRLMLNPEILRRAQPFEAEEGCLSLSGTRSATRYGRIVVRWQDLEMKTHTDTYEGFTAQIIQHEIDHCDGILI